jgi:hypothetical protein
MFLRYCETISSFRRCVSPQSYLTVIPVQRSGRNRETNNHEKHERRERGKESEQGKTVPSPVIARSSAKWRMSDVAISIAYYPDKFKCYVQHDESGRLPRVSPNGEKPAMTSVGVIPVPQSGMTFTNNLRVLCVSVANVECILMRFYIPENG